ncbi:hypothetical protein [Amycolatopsis sp. NPDC051102]|uniref:hypothetical protein n=1 Tax=Amycolatopsis sp. NPDC051102 TaxID=3155163 RepID=UPI0034150E4C
MSTELRIAVYFDDVPPPPGELVCRLAEVFAGWPQASAEFRGLKVLKSDRHTKVGETASPLSTAGLCAAAHDHGAADELFSTRSSFSCWRFPRGTPEPGSAGVWLEAWGPEWTVRNHEDRAIGGEAALSVFDVRPFVALLDPGPHEAQVNPRVEENLDALTALVFRLVEALTPRSIKVFSAHGLYLPTNAHLLYLRDEEVVLDDLALLARAWTDGLPAHHTGPLAEARPDDMANGFHSWRTAEQRERLWQELSSLLPRAAAVTAENVRTVLKSNRFDTFTMPVGVTVLDYPHFMNAFLDRFYLEVLAAAR